MRDRTPFEEKVSNAVMLFCAMFVCPVIIICWFVGLAHMGDDTGIGGYCLGIGFFTFMGWLIIGILHGAWEEHRGITDPPPPSHWGY